MDEVCREGLRAAIKAVQKRRPSQTDSQLHPIVYLALQAYEANRYKHRDYDPASPVGMEAVPVTGPTDGSTRQADVTAGDSTQNTVPCGTCGKPMEDRGAAAQWCGECYDKLAKAT